MSSVHSVMPSYRPDIDGLRALAVVSVVIFHAFPSVLGGGFVGVDIFFVISGFLISSLIFRALDAGYFSFSSFYARRINRIFPALITVLACTFFAAWFVLLSDELKQLGNHLSRAVIFLSNFILWHESGYFDNAAETKPLLHLWSLGIEEQFYIVWPFVVWAIWRLKTWRLRLMVVFFVASLIWNLYQSEHDLTQDFYSPFTRFWELISGALLAYQMKAHKSITELNTAQLQRAMNFRGFLGCGFLIFALLLTDASKAFPGFWAMFPVLGAMLVISAGAQSWVGRVVFSNPVVVWLGTISYPLYLWHWPILSFARIIEGGTPSVMLRVVAVVSSLVLAWASFVFVEKPIRFAWQFRFKTLILIFGMVTIGALGYAAHKTDGFPDRDVIKNREIFNVGDIGHDSFHDYYRDHFFMCADPSLQGDASQWKGIVRCFQSKKNHPVDLLLLGDSHAEHLFLGLAENLSHLNVGFYGQSVLPVLSEPQFRTIFEYVLSNHQIKAVLVSALWAGRMNEVEQGKNFVLELDQTVTALLNSGKKVYVSDDIPQFGFDPQRCKFQRPFTLNIKCEEPITLYQAQREKYMAALQALKQRHSEIELIDLSALMCNDTSCSMARNGQVLYRDNNHLNIPGSQYVGAQIVAQHPSLGKLGVSQRQ